MKKAIKFLLLVFVFSALFLSTMSVKDAKGVRYRDCKMDIPYTYKLPYFVRWCACHGEPNTLVECRWAEPSSQCYQTFCEGED